MLAGWILAVGASEGYRAQGTSVPGVAQRTGTTIYYIEMVPDDGDIEPALALTPVPGDVDIVIASELMEAGRAILRGFVTADRTILIGSTHRIYAISEKSALGNGIADSGLIIEQARRHARIFLGFDMEEAAARSHSVISSVMLGALAGSGALPFSRHAFETAISASAIAVDSNLRGFSAGFDGTRGAVELPKKTSRDRPAATSVMGRSLEARVLAQLPAPAQSLALHGVNRLMDYQDAAYASLYLTRLHRVVMVDRGDDEYALTSATARHLALWMSYEDVIRVADLKTRADRMARVRDEIQVDQDQLVAITEFMHPRLREVCEALPAAIGRRVLGSKSLTRLLAPLFRSGRFVQSTSLCWFVALSLLAALRRWRRGTMRYHEEQQRVEAWLALVIEVAGTDQGAALELVKCQQLIKGYGDIFDRSLRSFTALTAAYQRVRGHADAAAFIGRARQAALQDEDGNALAIMLRELA